MHNPWHTASQYASDWSSRFFDSFKIPEQEGWLDNTFLPGRSEALNQHYEDNPYIKQTNNISLNPVEASQDFEPPKASKGEGSTPGTVAAISGLIGDISDAYFTAASDRYRNKIKEAELKINKSLSSRNYTRRMTSHYQAYEDMIEKVTQNLLNIKKNYLSKQADMKVMQSNMGQEGMSRLMTQNNLSKSYHTATNITINNFRKAEHASKTMAEGINDQRFAEDAGFSMQELALNKNYPDWLYALRATGDGGVNALDTYLKFIT